jgi:hypothetical protein
MIRDKIKNSEYFEGFLNEEKERILNFTSKLSENSILNDRIPAVQRKMFLISLGITIADFSMGKNNQEIANDYKKTICFSENGWEKTGGYTSMLWMLSLGILLNITDHDFNQLVKLIDDSNMEDYLLDYLISSKIPNRKISSKIIFEDPYKKIVDITKMNKNEAQISMYQYLEKYWYGGHNDSYWFDNHKSKHNTYFGYWSFESAAIVKIMHLDDVAFKDNLYYPYDMVH